MMDYKIEICANSVASCLEAQKGGAHRVELCASIPEGGTTPSYATIALARELLNIKLHVIIRPRGGDFLYSSTEHQIMLNDIEIAKKLNADGVVIGCLTPHGDEMCIRDRQNDCVRKTGKVFLLFDHHFFFFLSYILRERRCKTAKPKNGIYVPALAGR